MWNMHLKIRNNVIIGIIISITTFIIGALRPVEKTFAKKKKGAVRNPRKNNLSDNCINKIRKY